MNMTPVEIIAWIIIVSSLIKMVLIIFKPRSWMNMSSKLLSKTLFIQVAAFVLGAIMLFYLLQEITIIQVLACLGLSSMLFLLGLAEDVEYFSKKYQKQIKEGKLWRQHWFYALVWFVILLWALKELLFI